MRFHVLGLGSTGSLVAFHLRRVLSHNHDVHLIYRTDTEARGRLKHPGKAKEIRVEHNGSVSVASGFKTESMHQESSMVYDMVFNPTGKLRLPDASFSPDVLSNRAVPVQDRREADIGQKLDQGEIPLVPRAESMKILEINSLFVSCKVQSALYFIRKLQHRLTPRSTVVLLQNGALALYEQLCSLLFQNPLERPKFILASFNHNSWEKHYRYVVHTNNGDFRFAIVPDGKRDFEKSRHDTNSPREQRALNLDDIALLRKEDDERSPYISLRNTVAVLQSMTDLQPKWEPMSTLTIRLRRKLVIGSVINPITALLGCRTGELFGNNAAQRLGQQICVEASNVFLAESAATGDAGPGTDFEYGERYRAQVLGPETLMEDWQRVARLSRDTVSSMLSDIRQGKIETEIDYLNGYLVRLGKRYTVYTGVNGCLVEMIKLRASIPIDG